ncbi:DUF2334 domain-containing protein [Teredinibacter sp. KSP-S5-2]|uniref:DUF2334 domain-containing protein n=1 Tax=Teredinibacter sp. KSP-S5-2 TaxID=3034506 RepID=UPI002935201D|nr:DUF2334 domain-containing protein [Teredinibacter sp. KSP-S5-2]WNO10671.1 DUF2334 domain-containing protein [Teredinibacter sp. KSP-S5-2]
MKAVISIHDVMPETMAHTFELLKLCTHLQPFHIYLLIVPGLNWQPHQIEQLKELETQGYQLAGHGWQHHCKEIKTIKHRLHSVFISRNVAEHLSLTTEQLHQLILRNYNWFIDSGFNAPELYVPPAWAMGNLPKTTLKDLPFKYYETTNGIYHVTSNNFKRLPLAGFEADNTWRKIALNLWNQINQAAASQTSPLRIALHPYDLDLKLHTQLKTLVSQVSEARSLAQVFST